LDFSSDNKIYMRTILYDEKSARHHIKRVTDILTKPTVLSGQQSATIEEEEKLSELHAKGLSDEEVKKQEEEIIG